MREGSFKLALGKKRTQASTSTLHLRAREEKQQQPEIRAVRAAGRRHRMGNPGKHIAKSYGVRRLAAAFTDTECPATNDPGEACLARHNLR